MRETRIPRDPHRPDPERRSGVNSGDGSVWASRVAPVTGRQARKVPGWTPVVAGGEYVAVRPVARVARDADIGVRNYPRTVADVAAWQAFTYESARVARGIVSARCFPAERATLLARIAARTLTVPVGA